MKRINQISVLMATTDYGVANVLKACLWDDRFALHRVFTSCQMLQLLTTCKPDIIIAEIALLDAKCWEALTQIKEEMDITIIILGNNRKNFEWSKVIAGYAAKPSEFLSTGSLTINAQRIQAFYKGHDIGLTRTEFRILETLVLRSKQTLTRADIIEMVWGKEFKGNVRVIDSHIRSLRQKLVKKTGICDYIQTVHGVGYRFVSDN